MNQLFQQLGGQMPSALAPINVLQQQFDGFRRNFRGDPMQIINQMGLTQQQLNQAQSVARQVGTMLGIKP